ncbi:AAA family ATPase [Candidatus Parcubacteria bacterium]|nr:AAA family ATPase [Candidatus Parcubacteria bacterium]
MKQEEALNILKLGFNVFLTGPAGSGKTFLIEKYIEYLRSKKVSVGVTASTGIAATYLSGITIHSWSGLKVIESGMSKKQIDSRIKSILKNEILSSKIQTASVLIIDEISMLDAEYLGLVDQVCQAVKKIAFPFGGLQIVLSGDFFQLPPVNKKGKDEKKFAYLSGVWKNAAFKTCYLDEQHRYTDKKYIRVLNDIRKNKIKKETLEALKSRMNKPVKSLIKATKLYTTNSQIDAINDYELSRLSDKEFVYDMRSGCRKGNEYILKQMIASSQVIPQVLRLKKGAVVMFIKNNFDSTGINGYVNGTLGKVVGFTEEAKYPKVETMDKRTIIAAPASWKIKEDDIDLAWIRQIPLRLAWAITVHKSQGMSLDEAIIDLGNTFEYGMGYVALSRVRSLSGVCLLGLNKLAVRVNPEIVELDKVFIRQSKEVKVELDAMGKKEIKRQQKEFMKSAADKSKAVDLFDEVFNK